MLSFALKSIFYGIPIENSPKVKRSQDSDSSSIIDACKGDEMWWNEASTVFVDYVDLATAIDDISFSHCPREANRVAHELARFCFSNCSTCN
jgi:hypothetical protein